MEVTTRNAAAQLGVSQRQVQRLAHSGRVVQRSIAGRTVVASRSLLAASRSSARGRRWEDRTAAAACELLEHGTTERITGSQRSRLRARLRDMPAAELAYQLLGERVTLWRRTGAGARQSEAATSGFSGTGNALDVLVDADTRALARASRLIEDGDGTALLIELDTGAPQVAQDVALYAYGDERESSAARQRLETRRDALA